MSGQGRPPSDRRAHSSGEPGLSVIGLVRSYGGRRVVDGVSLDVRPGEVVGLLGPNGAGKTTSFRIIAGLEAADAGQVLLDGQDLAGLPLWRRVRRGLGYLAQEPTVFRRLNVRENLAIALQAVGEQPTGTLSALLRSVGLEHVADQPAGRLSGGERRRLEIARCLAARPRVILLDEPFAGVDPVGVGALQDRVAGLAASGLGVLVTDHAVRETLGICDRAMILDQGRLVAAGGPEQVAADPHVRARYLGQDFELHSSKIRSSGA